MNSIVLRKRILWKGLAGEALDLCQKHNNTCSECGASDNRMENYSMMWHEGDIVCNKCDTWVRGFDAG